MAESPSDARPTETLLRILHRVLGPLPDSRAIAADDPLLDVGVTSFQLMRIVASVEQEFDIEFPDSALALTTFESVGSLAAVVETLVREQPGPPPDDPQPQRFTTLTSWSTSWQTAARYASPGGGRRRSSVVPFSSSYCPR